MGLFSRDKKICPLCGKKMGLLNGPVKLSDGTEICEITRDFLKIADSELNKAPFEEIERLFHDRLSIEEKRNAGTLGPSSEVKLGDTSVYFSYDDEYEIVEIKSSLTSPVTRIKYEEIKSFKGYENNSEIKKSGLGTAIAGAAIAGPAGLVAGAIIGKDKKKEMVMYLGITITLTDESNLEINFLKNPVKVNSLDHTSAYLDLSAALDFLSRIVPPLETSSTNPLNSEIDPVDQIRKFKTLLDEGILTQEEFNIKKKEILDL